MKDYKGTDLEIGDILKDDDGYFHRVIYIGKEKAIITDNDDSIEEAQEAETHASGWTQHGLNSCQFTIVKRQSALKGS